MLYCSKCGISIRGNKRCCPLCQGELTGTPSEAAFPTLKRARITSLSLVKLFTFLFIALEIVWSAVGFLANFTLAWVPFAMAGTLVAWLDAVLAVYFRNNVVKNITIQVYLVMIGGFVIDRFTGFHGWSVQWLIPCCFLGLVTTTIALGRGLPLRLEEYILYLAVDMVLSPAADDFSGDEDECLCLACGDQHGCAVDSGRSRASVPVQRPEKCVRKTVPYVKSTGHTAFMPFGRSTA